MALGLAALKEGDRRDREVSRLSKADREASAAELEAMMSKLQNGLRRFAEEHRDIINRDPVFRRDFQVMCKSAGVDPLASKKGFWGELLGVGDFYFELGIQVLDVCLSTRPVNGGVLTLTELRHTLQRMRESGLRVSDPRGSKETGRGKAGGGGRGGGAGGGGGGGGGSGVEVSNDDITRAVEKLAVLGNSLRIANWDGTRVVLSLPGEMSADEMKIFTEASRNGGKVSASKIAERKKWPRDRIQRSLDKLVAEAVVWVDDGAEERLYWFPSLALKKK